MERLARSEVEAAVVVMRWVEAERCTAPPSQCSNLEVDVSRVLADCRNLR